MSPFRYTLLQSVLILSGGCCAAVAVLLLPTLAVVLLFVTGFLSYALVHYICYHVDGLVWRLVINRCLTSLLLPNIPPRTVLPFERSELVHKEAQKLVQLILRDFITSWYYEISDNQEFPQETVRLLEHIATELQTRFQAIDVNKTILSLLPLLDPYLTALNEVGFVNERGKLTFDVCHPYCLMLFEKKPQLVHPAFKSKQTELEHLQRLADCFIFSDAIPSHYKHCDIAVQFVREVLVYRVFHPLLNLLCEPDFLLKAIPLILAKANDEKVKIIMSKIEEENKLLDTHLQQPTGLLTPYSISSLPMSVPLELESFAFTQSISYPWSSSNGHSLFPQHDRENALTASDLPSRQLEDTSFEDSVFVNLPPIYISRYVRVLKGSEVHIGYIIKFPSKMMDQDDLISVSLEGEEELESLKRYSEFVRFHKSLVSSPLDHLVKGLTLPDRKIVANILTKISFSSGEPDPATVLERKEGLERYLNGIVAIKEVRESDMFKQYLLSGVSVLHDSHIVSSNKPQSRGYGWTLKDWRKSTAIERTIIEPIHSFPEVLLTFTETYLPITPQYVPSSLPLPQSSCPTPVTQTQSLAELVPAAISSLFSQESGDDHVTLALEREEKSPLINVLLSLANEATRTISPELWLTSEATQLALLGLCGDTIDSYMTKELYEVVTDETRWARALFNLRHLLWPDGVLSITPSVSLSKAERQLQRTAAIQEIKDFLPNMLPWLVGGRAYDATIEHCLNCIQNPKINRHFLYRAIDILFLQIVPEFKDKDFRERLVKLRTKPSFAAK